MLPGGPGTPFTVRKQRGRAPGPQGAAPQGPALASPPCERREGAEQQIQPLAQQASQSLPALRVGDWGRGVISCLMDETGRCTEQGTRAGPSVGRKLVPRGWGGGPGVHPKAQEGGQGPPPSPSAERTYHARRTRLPLLDQLAASLLASYHSKGGIQGNNSPCPSSARAGRT